VGAAARSRLMIGGYGYLASRLAGFPVVPALVRAAGAAAIGGLLILVRALLH
jgi:hypothetical protein